MRFASLLFLLVSASSAWSQNDVQLFRDADFMGPSFTISKDWTYTFNPDQNDWISSIKIPKGWQVIVYEHEWQGESMLLSTSWTIENSADFWNDRISSIKVIPPKETVESAQWQSTYITVFKNSDFTGEGKVVSADWNLNINNDDYYSWNDKVNSIKVPPGCSARIYKYNDFWGSDYLDIAADWSSLDYPDWKNQISSIRIVTNGASPVVPGAQGNSPGVVVFSEDHFKGESRIITSNWNLDINSNDYRKWNDNISSIKIAPGWSVRIYKYSDFWGSDFLDIASDWRAADYPGWNDQISSIKVVQAPPTASISAIQPVLNGYVKVYKGTDFSGESLVVEANLNLNFGNEKFYKWNDKINSIRIPPGWSIRIYKYSDFWGSDYLDLAGDWSSADLSGWKDQISSIKILNNPQGHTCGFANGITIFSNTSCSGESMVISDNWNLKVGHQNYSKWNDKVNAIRVPEGWCVRIYKYNDFWGSDYLDITGDWSSDAYPDWRNSISSIEILHRPDRCH